MSKSPITETQILRLLEKRFKRRSPGLVEGIGDDAAVIHPRGAGERWVITTDMLLEDIDFRNDWLTPAQLGHKALAANLSDLAAMGARPRFYTAALGLPSGVTEEWIDDFFGGMTRLGKKYGAALIGGDLSRSACGIQVTITAIGETRRKKYLRRSGGRPGDLIYVTGTLGRAASGLKLLSDGARRGRTVAERQALRAHRTPEPRCPAGEWLAQSGLAGGMMDLSDGLSLDLSRLCAASRTGAEIYAACLPLFAAARSWGCDPLDLGLNGGEDFELLFSVPPAKASRLENCYPEGHPPITRIGKLTRRKGLRLLSAPGMPPTFLTPSGFDHFL